MADSIMLVDRQAFEIVQLFDLACAAHDIDQARSTDRPALEAEPRIRREQVKRFVALIFNDDETPITQAGSG